MIDHYKVQLIARGFTQVHSIDYEKTFAPILRIEFLRILLAFAAYFSFEIKQMNVPNIYLKGDFIKKIYIRIFQGYQVFFSQKNNMLCFLWLLYNLKQSEREWNIKMKQYLKSINFIPITSDNCVFINKTTHVIIALYVDSFLIFAKNITLINIVKKELFRGYKIKDENKVSFILSM